MIDRPGVSSAADYWTEGHVVAAVDALRRGDLVLVKGDIGYGLFGTSEPAIRRMYEAKGRSYGNPCIFIGDLDVLDDIAALPSDAVRDWCEETAQWTTFAVVAHARPDSRLLAGMDPWVRSQAVTGGTLAVFLRTGPFIAEMVRGAFSEGWVFVGSSANRSGAGNNYRLDEVPTELVEAAAVTIDHGQSAYANPDRKATTIVDTIRWGIRRRGVNSARIEESFGILAAQHATAFEAPVRHSLADPESATPR